MPVSVHHPRYQALQAGMATLLKTAGLSQEQLADRLGVGQSYVSKIERGEAYVDVLVFVDWCNACDIKAGQALDHLIAVESR